MQWMRPVSKELSRILGTSLAQVFAFSSSLLISVVLMVLVSTVWRWHKGYDPASQRA